MNTAQNIKRLERVLAASFWQDKSRRCVMDQITIEIAGRDGAYSWHMNDADDGSHGGLPGPFRCLEDAKSSAFGALENGLRVERERFASTQS
jgi:hypothetical protein